ncbi:MAG TPA: PQQ-binding-like beta-propeller repeat protein [Vicinamibacterales bacterium]|nr:PQQ-binding-like beta-propeller repeat protein [Vicinamibacterales bacterium]
MVKRLLLLAACVLVLGVLADAQKPELPAPVAPYRVALGDWPEARGPHRTGISDEKGLIEKWALNGQNFLWRAPYGGRSAPIVMGNRVYVQNPSGLGDAMQERVMALDADTGKAVWEYKFNVFQSDVPPHRVGWASPAADPETGDIYALGVGATVIALSKDGKLLWDRSIGEEFAAFTTHGGRTMSPIIDGNLVIVSAAVSNWGANAGRAQRFIALDKRTGEIAWVANPGGRPYDTAYALPVITTINGLRLLICGIGDGGVYAMKPQTGEKVWGTVIAKRAVNTGVAVSGTTVLISHGDENLDVPELGMIAAIDGSQTGDIKTVKWSHKGEQYGFSSPVIDGSRVYQVENGSRLHAYDLGTGKPLWVQTLGTIQKAPLVLADGKLYVGTESGKFFIVRPSADKAEILSEVEMPASRDDNAGQSAGIPEPIFAGAAISRRRIFFVSTGGVYAIGPKTPTRPTGLAVDEAIDKGQGDPAWMQVSPTEVFLKPGQSVKLVAKLFDAKGRYLGVQTGQTWTLQGLKGSIAQDGTFTAAADGGQAGTIKATAGALSGEARATIVRPLPWTETFDSYADGAVPPGWINVTAGKMAVATVDGQKVLSKAPDPTIFKRFRGFVGPTDLSNYTVEADVRGTSRRRQMSDLGVTAQRYTLVLYGNAQQLKIEPWEPETHRSVAVPYEWKPDTWYHLKLRVENMPDGKVRARGKAWPAGQPEPAAWAIEKIDPIGNHKGAPGFFVDAEFGAAIDNIKVSGNQ